MASVEGTVQWVAVDLAIFAVVVALGLLAVAVRRWLLMRRGGVEMSLRLRRGRWGSGWVFGVGLYRGDSIEWFRTFSLAWRPKRLLSRRYLRVRSRRAAVGAEAYDVPSGHVILVCELHGQPLELSLAPGALTGILAWLESALPGENLA